MNVTPEVLKDYVFGELNAAERRAVETAAAADSALRDELVRLQLTQSALFSLRDEELPRRIAFVSDKVFEPTWWQVWLHSGPRLGFASAALLAGAGYILYQLWFRYDKAAALKQPRRIRPRHALADVALVDLGAGRVEGKLGLTH